MNVLSTTKSYKCSFIDFNISRCKWKYC